MNPSLVPPPPRAIASAGMAWHALRRDAATDLAIGGALLVAVAAALGSWGGLGADLTIKALAFYGAGAWLVWRGLGRADATDPPHPHARFGAANRITLGRMAAMCLMAALVGEAVPASPPGALPAAAWALVAWATVTALLDAVDGALARRSGLASRFGARFDMETDAAFTLVLCALVLQAGQAGAWVLASGLMRYAFVGASFALPWLNGALPPSRRRQTVCVIQITALIVCLGPIVPAQLATTIAAISLLLLAWSFAIDILHLARHRHAPPETRP